MSMFLFRLGGKIAKHRGLVVAFWVLMLAALIGGNRTLGTDYDDTFVLPGASSQAGQDVLAERFGLTGTNGQVLVTATSGKITDKTNADAVADLAKKISDVDDVTAGNPLEGDYALVSDDKKSTIIQVRFVSQNPDEEHLDEATHAATPESGSTIETLIGGDAFKDSGEPSKIPELLGLLVSFMILAVTFGSFIAAGMPILTSLVGVGITLSGVVIVTHATTVSSSAPTLAEMLGLAVGIDYALFILSRHRRNLGEGHSPTESMSRALATAGSAVVFAGATVVIALCGLTVAASRSSPSWAWPPRQRCRSRYPGAHAAARDRAAARRAVAPQGKGAREGREGPRKKAGRGASPRSASANAGCASSPRCRC